MERQAFNSLNEAALQVQLEEGWSNPPGPTKEGNPRKRVVRDLKRKLGLPVSWHGGVGGDEPEYDPTGASRDLHKSRQDRKSKEAQSAKKKELTRKKLYPKSGLKGEKKTFADKLFNHVEYDEVDSMVLEYFDNYFGDNLNEDTSDEDIMNAVYDLIDLTEAVLLEYRAAFKKRWKERGGRSEKEHKRFVEKGAVLDKKAAAKQAELDKNSGFLPNPDQPFQRKPKPKPEPKRPTHDVFGDRLDRPRSKMHAGSVGMPQASSHIR